jgi:hypothetical protein
MAQRVSITIAARLTGRSEKTIRGWLQEDPCPLSVEWGAHRGGRRVGDHVEKGRTRLLDVQELKTLHNDRCGTEWHPEHMPQPDISALAEDVRALTEELQAMRQRVTTLEAIIARRHAPVTRSASNLTLPAADSEQEHHAPQKRTVARQESGAIKLRPPLPDDCLPFPDGWIPISTWCKNHGATGRSQQTIPRIVPKQTGGPWGRWSENENRWYKVASVWSEDDQRKAFAFAIEHWADKVRQCDEDPSCLCHELLPAAYAQVAQ